MSTKLISSKSIAASLLLAFSISPLLLGNMAAKAATPPQVAANPTTPKSSNTPSKPKMANPTTPKSSNTPSKPKMANPTTHSMNSTASKGKNKNSNSATTILSMGSKGDMVKKIQTFLKKQKIYTGQVNGTFDQRTCQAVMKFQRSQHLKSDGMVGIHTQQALQKAGLS